VEAMLYPPYFTKDKVRTGRDSMKKEGYTGLLGAFLCLQGKHLPSEVVKLDPRKKINIKVGDRPTSAHSADNRRCSVYLVVSINI
jgi:hypothetical protein